MKRTTVYLSLGWMFVVFGAAEVTGVNARPLDASALLLDTRIESPAVNDSARAVTAKQPGDTVRFQLFAPDEAGASINGWTVVLSLPDRAFDDYVSSVSGAAWAGDPLVVRQTSGGPSLSMLSVSAVSVPRTGYLGEITLTVSRALPSDATLIVRSASLGAVGGQWQLDVSGAVISFDHVECPGDFDEDGSVGFADFLLFVAAFGASAGDARYDARMDMDTGGDVGFADFLLFVPVFGTTCETPPPSGGSGGGTVSERDILVALYNATDGPNWNDNTNWLSDRPLGEWHGVTTDDAGRVTNVSLYSNQLSGPIPAELGSLQNLRNLHLNTNRLTGQIPAELGNLANLEYLWLHYNQLNGQIPVELGSLSNLEGLSLTNNQLNGQIPVELGSLSNLLGLTLANNRLTGQIPAGLGSPAKLQNLDLSRNQLSGQIPAALGSLASLKFLRLYDNQLTGPVPAALGSLANLQWLHLNNNAGLSGPLPGSLTGLNSLKNLNLSDTRLCAPTDAAFQTWLNGIADKTGVVNCVADYDRDDDGLIEVATLAQLNAIRWDTDGNGVAESDTASYNAAFPDAPGGMGCPNSGCTGYELVVDLNFDTNNSGGADAGDAYWNNGQGWAPIGNYGATFEGNFHLMSSLYIDRATERNVGLFSQINDNGKIRNVRLYEISVTGGRNSGGLVGSNRGAINASYATGSVTGGRNGGGLVGSNRGAINASYATGSVRTSGQSGGAGGLVGQNWGGAINASYATGSVRSSGQSSKAGGLVGSNWTSTSTISASYATGSVRSSGSSSSAGGLVGSNSGTITASYWDTQTSGQSASAGGEGKTTRELQSPTGYTGIYANWNLDLDGDGTPDDPWNFGTSSQYPVLK